MAVNGYAILGGFHFARIDAVVAVVLEKMGIGLGVGEVVDRSHFYLPRMSFKDGPQHLAADSSKAVDAHPGHHVTPPRDWVLSQFPLVAGIA